MKAAIHLNPKHIEYLEVSKNLKFNDIESLFNITKKLIMDNSETRNVSCLDCLSRSWTRSTLLNDRAVGWTKAKIYVYSDSVLCLGKIHSSGEAIEPWKGQVATFRVENNSCNELLGMDGEPIEFEWKNFPRFTALDILHKIQCDLEISRIDTGTIQWSNPFYVHLQWHRHLQDRSWGCLYLDIWQVRQ